MKSELKALFRSLPPAVQKVGYGVYFQTVLRFKTAHDASLKRDLFGDKARFIPPLYLMKDGTQDYRSYFQAGEESFELLTQRCGVKPTDRVLDIGSGIGRKTWPLLGYLSGSYEGLDPIARQVRWCQENIGSHYPNFRFQPMDVWSKLYNPKGRVLPSEYVLPFKDGEFDFVMLGSVFTHMFMPDMRHYVGEIGRVLRSGGQGMITYLLLNEESEALIAAGRSTQKLVFPVEEGAKADNPHRFETSIGHSEEAVLQMYRDLNMDAKVIQYGAWCGRPVEQHYQDVVHIRRR